MTGTRRRRSAPKPTELSRAIGLLARADLDLSVANLRDALWLALQADLRIHEADATPAIPRPSDTPAPDAARRDGRSRVDPGATGTSTTPETTSSPRANTGVFQGGAPIASDDSVKASPIRIPAGAALPGKLAIARAMRPFMQRWPSPRLAEIDEESTAEATAEQGGRVSLVFRPRPERWYEAVLVVEDAPSIDVWHETLSEFRQVLFQSGAFRDVRDWRLRFVAAKTPGRAMPVLQSASGARLPTDALASRQTRRLIFFATHGISNRWVDGSLARVLDQWSKAASLVIVHLLPPRLWGHTALGEPAGLVHAKEVGARAARLEVERFSWVWSLDDDEPRTVVPVVSLDPSACQDWSRMQMARGRRTPAMFLALTPDQDAPTREDESPGDAELVSLFQSNASTHANRLAVYLAPGPFTLPVARLIQSARFGAEARQSQLAELMLSGFVRRLTPPDATVHPDWVQYDVESGARPLLLRSLREEEALEIVDTLQRHVGRFIEQTLGKPVDFRALVRDEHGQFDLPGWAQPFASIGTALLGLRDRDSASVAPPDRRETPGDASTSADAAPLSVANVRAILEQRFGAKRVANRIDREFGALDPFEEENRRDYLFMAAVEMMADAQRERLLVLGVTAHVSLPTPLWQYLVNAADFSPLFEMNGIRIASDHSLVVEREVRATLARHITVDERPRFHKKITDAYRLALPVTPVDDGYHYQHFLMHASGALLPELAEQVLYNPFWLTRKVELGGVAALLDDLARFRSRPRITALMNVVTARGQAAPLENVREWVDAVLAEAQDDARADAAVDAAAAPTRWVTIIGTAVDEIDAFTREVTTKIAQHLALANVGLITGSWEGVDTIAALAYAEARSHAGQSVNEALLNVYQPSTQSRLPGKHQLVANDAEQAEFTFVRSEAVILIGGRGYTRRNGRLARSWGVPVIPVACTGGDAETIFEELVVQQDYSADDVLARPTRPDDADEVAERVVALVDRDPAHVLRIMAQTYLSTADLALADRIDARIVRTLRQHEDLLIRDWLNLDGAVDQLLEAFCIRLQPNQRDVASLLDGIGA